MRILCASLVLLAAFTAGCKHLRPKSAEQVRQDRRKQLILADWTRQVAGQVHFQDGKVGFIPESFRRSSCYGTREFEEYTFALPPQSEIGFGTEAIYCPATRSYWVNRYGGSHRYYNGWAGPFPFEFPADVAPPEKK